MNKVPVLILWVEKCDIFFNLFFYFLLFALSFIGARILPESLAIVFLPKFDSRHLVQKYSHFMDSHKTSSTRDQFNKENTSIGFFCVQSAHVKVLLIITD